MAQSAPRKAPQNPFVVSLLASGAHFADREAEVARMADAFRTPGAKMVVYGDRRLGKTSALERAAEIVRREGGMVAVAALSTASDASEAAQRILAAVQNGIGSSWRETLARIASSVNASIEITPPADPGSLPSVKFGFGRRESASTKLLPDVLDAINTQMARRKETLGLGLDEFQRIHEWGGEDAEWALRESLQRHRQIAYVLAGSKRHLIEAMIGNKGRALWKLVEPLELGPMDEDVLADWIVGRARATQVKIPATTADLIVKLARPRTRDVVQLARIVWDIAATRGEAMDAYAPRGLERLVQEQAALYEMIWSKLTARQQMVLRAIAAEGDVQITSADTLHRYRIGAKSSVQSTVDALVEAEHLVRIAPGRYEFDDPFLRRWVQVYGLPDIGAPTPSISGPGK
jgi:hypothetical protein